MTALPPVLARDWSLDSLTEGTVAQHGYVITKGTWEALTGVFGDVNPVHVDPDVAGKLGFPNVVMHGAILQGFVSHFVGMVLPGRRSLLMSVDLRYLAVSFLGDSLVVKGEISQRVESQRVVVVSLTIENLTQGHMAARGRVQVRIADAL
jgi:acyl dehydratase